MERELKVFSGQSNIPLAKEIAESLGIGLGRCTTQKFANDNLIVRYEESLRESDVFLVQSLTSPVHDHLMELLLMIDAAKGASARRVTAVIPYYSYARSDKKDAPRISVAGRLVADLIQTAGADRVLTVTLHSPQVHGFFKVPVDQLSGETVLAHDFVTHIEDLPNAVIVAPDAGEIKRALSLARKLNLPLAFIEKQRLSDAEVQARALVGDVKNKVALIVDDEIATAASLAKAVDTVLNAGAIEVYAAATHGVFVGPALTRIQEMRAREVVTTNTCLPPSPKPDKIRTISVGPLIAEAIYRTHKGESVSALFT